MNASWALTFLAVYLALHSIFAHAKDLNATAKPALIKRLHKEEGIKLEQYSAPTKTIEDSLLKQKQSPVIKYDLKEILKDNTPDRVLEGTTQLSIAEIRTSALKNNLTLDIVRFDIKIAQTLVDEERAKFDQIIYGNLKYSGQDLPSQSGDRFKFSSNNPALNNQNVKLTLQERRIKGIDGELGIAIPLRTGGIVKISSPFENKDKNGPFETDEYRTGLRFSISQPLLRDAGIAVNEASIEIAGYNQQATLARTRLQSIRVLAIIDKAYWSLDQAWTELEIRRQQHEYASQNLAMVQLRIKEGLTAAIELNRAQFGVTERIEQLIIANTNLKLAQRQLKFLLNDSAYPIGSEASIAPSTPPTLVQYTFDREKLVDQATENRLELLEVELKLAEDATQINYLQNQTLPLFTLDYSYGALSNSANNFGNAYGNVLNVDYNDWYIGFSFEMPVTNAARLARLNRALEQRLQRLSTKALQKLSVEREINDSLDITEQHWQRIVAARQQVGIAGMNYDAELKQFKEGLRTMTEVLEMLTRLGDAQLKEIRAITDYQVALIDLSFATGTLLGYSNVRFAPVQ